MKIRFNARRPALIRHAIGAVMASLLAACLAWPVKAQTVVDLQLVLAVDCSNSVNDVRFELQKLGYAEAFRNPQVMRAIASGAEQSIAVTFVQWTGPFHYVQAVPWTLINDSQSARAFADAIANSARELFGGSGTSISGAIDTGMLLLSQSPFKSRRRTIDISGDGRNSSGRSVVNARDDAVANGVTINGLPILSVDPILDRYFYSFVIGGPGAFMIPAANYENFADAVLKKLILEIAAKEDLPAMQNWGAVLARSP
ncbi:MAG: DUF1194 domain-containing protein [Xanthobacteraceae bacterium]